LAVDLLRRNSVASLVMMRRDGYTLSDHSAVFSAKAVSGLPKIAGGKTPLIEHGAIGTTVMSRTSMANA